MAGVRKTDPGLKAGVTVRKNQAIADKVEGKRI